MTTIRKGSRGDEVKTLQELLGVTADGIFGAKTRAALIQWQTAHGLEADGICGPITWAALTGEELPEKPKDYKQYDSRWGSKGYTSSGNKKQTMARSGCGPTAMADIVSTWFDAALTPYDLAQMAVEHGFRTKNDGTSWAFFDWVATQYEFSGYGRVSASNMDASTMTLTLRTAASSNSNTLSSYFAIGR